MNGSIKEPPYHRKKKWVKSKLQFHDRATSVIDIIAVFWQGVKLLLRPKVRLVT